MSDEIKVAKYLVISTQHFSRDEVTSWVFEVRIMPTEVISMSFLIRRKSFTWLFLDSALNEDTSAKKDNLSVSI